MSKEAAAESLLRRSFDPRRTGPASPAPSVRSHPWRAPMSRYLTVEEVAEALGVSASWVYKHKDLLGGVRLGKRSGGSPSRNSRRC